MNPGRGARVGCRHAHGLDIVWSARHGVTTRLEAIATPREVDPLTPRPVESSPVSGDSGQAAGHEVDLAGDLEGQFLAVLEGQFAAPGPKRKGATAARGRRGASAARPRRGRARRFARVSGCMVRVGMLYSVLALGVAVLIGIGFGLSHLIGLHAGVFALGLGVAAGVLGAFALNSRHPVRAVLVTALESAPGLRVAQCRKALARQGA